MPEFSFRWPESGETSPPMSSVDVQVFDELGDPAGLYAGGSGTSNAIQVTVANTNYRAGWQGVAEGACAATELQGSDNGGGGSGEGGGG